jgi:hypothetical protein
MLFVALVTQDDGSLRNVADQPKKPSNSSSAVCDVSLPLMYGAAEPVLETRWADARVIAGG